MKNTYSNAIVPLAGTLSVIAALLALGCGGSGKSTMNSGSGANSTSTTSSRATGIVRIAIRWPALPTTATTTTASRLIPEGAKSIVVSIRSENNQTQYFSQVIARRPGHDTDEVTFPEVPVGNVRVHADAVPNADGTIDSNNHVMASGDTFQTVQAGQTVTAPTLTLFSTIKKIVVAGDVTTPLKVGEQRTLHAQAFDASGALVLSAPSAWNWIGSGLGAANYEFDKDQALVTAFRPGSFTLALHYLEGGDKLGGASVYNDPVTITVVQGNTLPANVRIIDLGALPSSTDTSYASSLTEGSDENSIAVGGYSNVTATKFQGFLWKTGHMIGIGELDPNADGSEVHGVAPVKDANGNPVYTAVGLSYVGNNGISKAVSFTDTNNNNVADPGELKDRGWSGIANAINPEGAIVGKTEDNPFNAFVDSPRHGKVNLPGFADSGLAQASAYDINVDAGSAEEIVGSSFGHGPSEDPCYWRWNDGTGKYDPAVDLGLVPGTSSGVARSLKEDGTIAGYCQGGRDYAFVWTAAHGLVTLPGLGSDDQTSRASGINHYYDPNTPHLFDGTIEIAGHVINGSGQIVAVLWTAATPVGPYTAHDLNSVLPKTSGWTLKEAQAVNGNGLIVGYGTNPQGKTHAFLLIP